ncbi:iron uptake system protein EfeO [Fictibacillus sp. Mic-4]|uniref:iron uptake system protein EfeO n=1 Tax=Fictibacillus sp. Mic-4 TaxID=3132826 RepID=UPI003CF0D43D
MKRFTSILSVLVVSSLALSACNTNQANDQKNNEKAKTAQSAQNAVGEGTDKLLQLSDELTKALDQKDSAKVKKLGEQINKTWFSFENKVRKSAPLLYTETEKSLLPLVSGTKIEPVDQKTLSGLNEKMAVSLNKLKNFKPSKKGTANADLNKAVEQYKEYVLKQSNQLVAATEEFSNAVIKGEMEKAKKLYPNARTYYERIEPIAESFGDLDPKIDARENDVSSPSEWTGFHVIEKALWVNKTTKGQEKVVNQLVQDVKELHKKIEAVQLEPAQVVAGAVELLDEAATSKITGEEERYSHVDLVDLAANVEGSKAIFDVVKEPLMKKDPELANSIEKEFSALQRSLKQFKKGASFVSYNQLKEKDTRKISQQLNTLSESLSKVAKLLS